MIDFALDENHQNFEDFTKNIKLHFEQSDAIITAQRNVIKILEFEDKKVVAKSFKIPHFINRFAYRFIRDSKAKRSFLNAQKLVKLGVNTPAPIAYIEFFTPLLQESFYLCDYFAYDFEIRDVLNERDFQEREMILEAFVSFSYDLHQKGVYHIDYSPGNVLVKKETEGYHFSLVDVNRMKFLNFDDDLRFKNLSRFSASREDTQLIAKHYAKVSGIEESYALKRLFFYHDKHQQYRANKKRLKAMKGV